MAFHVTQCPGCESTFNTNARLLQSAAGKVRCGACLTVFEAANNFIENFNAENFDNDDGSVFIGNNPVDFFDPSSFFTRSALQMPESVSNRPVIKPALSAESRTESKAESRVAEADQTHSKIETDFAAGLDSGLGAKLAPITETDHKHVFDTEIEIALSEAVRKNEAAKDATDNLATASESAGSSESNLTTITEKPEEIHHDFLAVVASELTPPEDGHQRAEPDEAEPVASVPNTPDTIAIDDYLPPEWTPDSELHLRSYKFHYIDGQQSRWVSAIPLAKQDKVSNEDDSAPEYSADWETEETNESWQVLMDPDEQGDPASLTNPQIPADFNPSLESIATASQGVVDLDLDPPTDIELDLDAVLSLKTSTQFDLYKDHDEHNTHDADETEADDADSSNLPPANAEKPSGFFATIATKLSGIFGALGIDDEKETDNKDEDEAEQISLSDLEGDDSDARHEPTLSTIDFRMDDFDNADSETDEFAQAQDKFVVESHEPSTSSLPNSTDLAHNIEPELTHGGEVDSEVNDATMMTVQDIGDIAEDFAEDIGGSFAAHDVQDDDQSITESEETDQDDSTEAIRARALRAELNDDEALEALPLEARFALSKALPPLELLGLREGKWGRKLLLLSACLLLSTTLAAQFFWQRLPIYSQTAQLRPLYEFFCRTLTCNLPAFSDLSAIRSDNLVVRSHPAIENALLVTLSFRNTASYPQAFPILILSFNSGDNSVIALREFEPTIYLDEGLQALDLMPVMSPVQIQIEMMDPGPDAVNYTVAFRRP